MKTSDINDPTFLQAVTAIDNGTLDELQALVNLQPGLLQDRLFNNQPGYFNNPYLIWFVADNPIRNGKLPGNILSILQFLIGAVKSNAPETCLEQLNYTLNLVATGKTPKECGVQLAMMDLLIDAGAEPNLVMGAITNGNLEAANHLINRGGKITLAAAIVLDRNEDLDRLIADAADAEKLIALTAAAFYGKTDKVKYLLNVGVDPNGYPAPGSGFHQHGTALHQAVSSGSLEVVKLLVNAGAQTEALDKLYSGTPLGWAIYMQIETTDKKAKIAFKRIEAYLKELQTVV
jgi:hypothetical protein